MAGEVRRSFRQALAPAADPNTNQSMETPVATPWDEQSRADGRSPWDPLLQAYLDGSLQLTTPLSLPQQGKRRTPPLPSKTPGFSNAAAPLGTQVIPIPGILPLPPIWPDGRKIGNALNDIVNGIVANGGYSPFLPPKSKSEAEICEDQLDKDMINCQTLKGIKGAQGLREYGICRQSAMQRYAECIKAGLGGVNTPPYWGKQSKLKY